MKKLISVLLFLFIYSAVSHAEDNFCLDNEGYLYPLIDSAKCQSQKDIKISKKEFFHIIDFEKGLRKVKLEDYRVNFDEIEQSKSNEQKEQKLTLADVKKIKKESIEKIKLYKKGEERKRIQEQKKQELLAKREERKRIQEQKKQEILAKREERKRIQEQKRQELLVKKAEKKKIQEQKRQELLVKKAEKKKIQEQKRQELLVKKAEKKRIEEEKRKQLLAEIQAKKDDEIFFNEITKGNETTELNENLKIVFFNKNIVKNNLLPELKSEDNPLDFQRIDNLEKEDFKKLVRANSNLILVIPKDYEIFSNNVSQNQMTSRVVTGIRQIPNPDYRRLEMEIRDTEQKAMMAKRESEMYEYKLQNQQATGYDWLDLLGAFANTGASISYHNKYRDAQNKLTDLINEYASTPMYLDQDVLSPYNYDVVNVKSEKKAHYNVIQYKNKIFYNKNLSFGEENNFNIAYNIQPQDKRYAELVKKYDTMDNVRSWENKKMASITIDNFLIKLENTEEREFSGLKDVYSVLDFAVDEKKSIWKKKFNKKKSKVASLTNSSSYEIKDERFESVVVVKTGSGLGTGFYVSDDEILTNYHVIEDALSISIIDQNKKRSSAVVIKKDLKRDLALLKTNLKGKPVSFYSGQLKQGEWVEALGHPKGRKFSLTKGSISAIRNWRSTYDASGSGEVLFIQTDAAINKGNSGGPLFYKNHVVGVNTQKMVDTDIEGLNFAVHFSEVQNFLNN